MNLMEAFLVVRDSDFEPYEAFLIVWDGYFEPHGSILGGKGQ